VILRYLGRRGKKKEGDLRPFNPVRNERKKGGREGRPLISPVWKEKEGGEPPSTIPMNVPRGKGTDFISSRRKKKKEGEHLSFPKAEERGRNETLNCLHQS